MSAIVHKCVICSCLHEYKEGFKLTLPVERGDIFQHKIELCSSKCLIEYVGLNYGRVSQYVDVPNEDKKSYAIATSKENEKVSSKLLKWFKEK